MLYARRERRSHVSFHARDCDCADRRAAALTRSLVTGAFGYIGSRIAERLLERGDSVLTLTRRDLVDTPMLLARRVETMPYDFSHAALAHAMAGVDTAYVTLWMRFPRGDSTWDDLVARVGALANAAAASGVRRLA